MPHFTYNENKVAELRQGDIIRRTPELEEVLRNAHPHYHLKTDNKYFIVLTQDCDLVVRDGKRKARYIELAAVRTVEVVIRRQIEKYRDPAVQDVAICTNQNRNALQQFLQRLLNNNEPEYFYLHKDAQQDFPNDCCALLALSIAIKADLHYQLCADAKILELQDSFRAKLGWLIGRMYSPVGTEDWPDDTLNKEISGKIRDLAVWVDQKRKRELDQELLRWKLENPDQALNPAVVKGLADKLPRHKNLVINGAMDIIKGSLPLTTEADIQRLTTRLRNDPNLSNLLNK